MKSTTKINSDGSISTQAQTLLSELKQSARSMEIRAEALRNDQARLDTFMSNIKWLLSVVGALIVATLAAIGYLGFESVSDIEERVRASVGPAVEAEIQTQSNLATEVTKIHEEYRVLEADFEKYQEWANVLSAVSSNTELANLDSSYAYNRISAISLIEEGDETQASEEERLTALTFLNAIILKGVEGQVDPNVLFNSAVDASRLGMREQAAQLAALASFARPSLSHRSYELQLSELFGQEYTFDEQTRELIIVELSQSEVRERAWAELMTLVAEVPRSGAEQVYSRAQNVAVRNRTFGHYTQMIEVMETSFSAKPDQVTSYAHATLAQLLSWESAEGWKGRYSSAVEAALSEMAKESPSASWYPHTARELVEEALRIGELDSLLTSAALYDIDLIAIISKT